MSADPESPDRRRRALTAMAVVAAGLVLLASPFVLLRRSSARVSDSEILGPNSLAAATLDVEVGQRTVAFHVTDMAAGDRAYGFIELQNQGTLPLATELTSTSSDTTLDRQLELAIWPSTSPCATSTAAGAVHISGLGGPAGTTLVGDPTPGVQTLITIEPAQRRSWCLEIHLPLDSGNELQGSATTQEIVVDAVHVVDPATTGDLIPGDPES